MIKDENNNLKNIANDFYPIFLYAIRRYNADFRDDKIKEYNPVRSLELTNILLTKLSELVIYNSNYILLNSDVGFGRETIFIIDKTSKTFLIFLTQNNFNNIYRENTTRSYIKKVVDFIGNKNNTYLFDEKFYNDISIAEFLFNLKITMNNDDIHIINDVNKVSIITYGYDKVYPILIDYNFVIPYNANDISQSIVINLLNYIDNKNSEYNETEISYNSEDTGHNVNGTFAEIKTDEEIENERKNDSEEDDNISFVSLK